MGRWTTILNNIFPDEGFAKGLPLLPWGNRLERSGSPGAANPLNTEIEDISNVALELMNIELTNVVNDSFLGSGQLDH